MPTYEFRCGECGLFDRVVAMQAVRDETDCDCGRVAPRVITAARLGRGSSRAMRLLDSTAATAERPRVISAVPEARRASGSDPRHRSLPRP